jgi:hypothetical protein
LALLDSRTEIACIEYSLNEDESLQFILGQHRTRRQWNAFVLIRLALTLEPHFQEKALNNMRAGGKYKAWTNLPEADRIDVRQEIAKVAGTGTGNVSKVKAILRSAHPNIISALHSGQLSIHRAWGWRNLPKAAQKEEFARREEERTQSKVLRGVVESRGKPPFNATETIAALRMLESHNPGCIVIRAGTRMSTVVTLGEDANRLNLQCSFKGDALMNVYEWAKPRRRKHNWGRRIVRYSRSAQGAGHAYAAQLSQQHAGQPV